MDRNPAIVGQLPDELAAVILKPRRRPISGRRLLTGWFGTDQSFSRDDGTGHGIDDLHHADRGSDLPQRGHNRRNPFHDDPHRAYGFNVIGLSPTYVLSSQATFPLD
jgi:hypothetical protein